MTLRSGAVTAALTYPGPPWATLLGAAVGFGVVWLLRSRPWVAWPAGLAVGVWVGLTGW